MKKLTFISLVILSLITNVSAATITFAWNSSCNPNVTGYSLYYGLTNTYSFTRIFPAYIDDCGLSVPAGTNINIGNYTNSVEVLGRRNNSVTVSDLVAGSTYAFSVVFIMTNSPAGNTNDVISEFSKEIVYNIPSFTTNYIPPALSGFIIKSIGP